MEVGVVDDGVWVIFATVIIDDDCAGASEAVDCIGAIAQTFGHVFFNLKMWADVGWAVHVTRSLQIVHVWL